MTENILPPARGTILKLAVTADLGESIHMEDVRFECRFFCSGLSVKSQTVKKEEMIQIQTKAHHHTLGQITPDLFTLRSSLVIHSRPHIIYK